MADDFATMHIRGGQGCSYRVVSAAYTATEDDYLILVDATSAPVTVTLPPVADAKKVGSDKTVGRMYRVMKIDGAANAVTVDADGSETINGSANLSLGTTQYADCLLVAAEDAAASEWLSLTNS